MAIAINKKIPFENSKEIMMISNKIMNRNQR
jgi:hypothetical protein